MARLLMPGQVVRTEPSGQACRVEHFIGGGGQGEVYRATLRGDGVALKWYFPHTATPAQRAALAALIRRGAPSTRFLWPVELAGGDVASFGYVMPLRPARYRSITDLLRRRVEPRFRVLVTAGLGLVDAFLQLHARGLCYRDISFGNAFFDPDTGDVLICDNDNVGIDGDSTSGVLGTPRFMAPEVVRREAWPSADTDLHSLAVLLFYMLMLHHPLEGRRESATASLDKAAIARLFGTEPRFIFDPNDDSNRPDPDVHRVVLSFWPLYPAYLQDLFTRAFTAGLRDPRGGRVREGQWRAALDRMRDEIVYCGACGAESFASVVAGPPAAPCWSCDAPLTLPPALHTGRRVIMLNYDTRLHPYQLDERLAYDFTSCAGRVVRHPALASLWGLRNEGGSGWVADRGAAEPFSVPPGASVVLSDGLHIHFGAGDGVVRAPSAQTEGQRAEAS